MHFFQPNLCLVKECELKVKNNVCKNCNKILPEGYKKKYCQSCMNKRVQKTKKGIKTILGTVASVAIAIVTFGKFGSKK